MDASLFTQLLQSGHALTADEYRQLDEACRCYPFCAPLQLMALQGGELLGTGVDDAVRARAELYLFDVRRMATPHFRNAATVVVEVEPDVDVLKEINSYHEVSFKTAPKSVILSHFLDTAGYDVSSDAVLSEHSVEDLNRMSLQQADDFCTETLAEILVNQGKREEALEVYRKLMAKYPEKSATFATRIATLQQESK